MDNEACLFDYILFTKRKGHLIFPSILCFPQFFAYSMNNILVNIVTLQKQKTKDKEETLGFCYRFFDILPSIIKHLFDKYEIEVDEDKLKQSPQTKTDGSHIFLESYLKNTTSIENYRKALLDNLLKFHNCTNINEVVKHLYSKNCCSNILRINTDTYPSSKNYLVLHNNNSTVFDNFGMEYILSTHFWGPFYWNIFHSLADKCTDEDENFHAELVEYLFILPQTIPCSKCKENYIFGFDKIYEFLDTYYVTQDIKKLYEDVHDDVSYKIHEKH